MNDCAAILMTKCHKKNERTVISITGGMKQIFP